jgi:hypothetical protein
MSEKYQRYSVDKISYDTAVKILEESRLKGIKANMVSGGIAFYIPKTKMTILNSLCSKFNTTPFRGNAYAQENMYFRSNSDVLII